MGWTNPSAIGTDWAVGEVATAAKMNSHLSDNLRYLKGMDGPVAIQDMLTATASESTTTRTGALASETTITNSQDSGGVRYAGLGFKGSSGTASAGMFPTGRILGSYLTADFLNSALIFQTGASATTYRDVMTLRGPNVGIGTVVPAALLHVAGAGGGFMFLSANAVDGTLQTLAPAGTVTQSAAFWAYDRNNTTPFNFVQVSGNMLALSQTFPLANTDTVTVTLTAGGAITVQRTAGTNGTHQVNMLVMFK